MSLIQDLTEEAPSKDVIARSLVDSAQRLNREAPSAADLTSAIEDILPESHIKGASVIRITLMDQGFELLDSGFFTPADDLLVPGSQQLEIITTSKTGKPLKHAKQRLRGRAGTLDPLEINYPVGSKYWWRLSAISPSSDGTIQMTFTDRVQDELLSRKDRLQANRNAMTRAEFLQSIVHKVPEARFHSEQLTVKEPIDPVNLTAGTGASSSKTPSGVKTVGLGANADQQTVKGRAMSAAQAAKVNLLLQTANAHRAGEAATVAAIYAATWESSMGDDETRNSLGYGGLLAGQEGSDKEQASWFFTGSHGYQGGGAIALEHGGISNPIEIAIKTEVPSIWPDNAYAREAGYPGDAAALAEARKIVQAGGGAAGGGSVGGGTTVETIQPYVFSIGLGSNIGETDWDGCVRLANEVNWEFFTDGPDVYYDNEMTLIKQKIAAVIRRTDPAVFDWAYDWENRNIATQFSLSLICDPFEFRAGEVLQLLGFGIDEASTANRPGCWLIQDIIRQQGTFVSQITLKQPEPPKNEPAPQVVTTTIPGGSGVSGGTLIGATGSINLSGVPDQVPGHPELQPAISKVVNAILAKFPQLQITSTTRGGHASGSYHYLGRAADLAVASYSAMDPMGAWIAANLTGSLVEGIHNPTLSVKNGKLVPSSFWGAATWAQHINHIHVAA